MRSGRRLTLRPFFPVAYFRGGSRSLTPEAADVRGTQFSVNAFFF